MRGPFKLSLFIAAAELPQMQEDVQSLKGFLAQELEENFDLEVVDVLKNPEKAVRAGVIATPTLLRGEPPPPLRVVGDFTNREKVLAALELS